ncbi:hypothetical protein D3C75_1336310 [compost metagenome]
MEAVQVSLGYQLHQILISGPVLRKKNQMIGLLLLPGQLILHGAAGYIDLAAQNGLYSVLDAGFIEGHCAIHDTMVG